MRTLRAIVLLAALLPGAGVDLAGARAPAPAPLPERLADTGLYVSGSTTQVRVPEPRPPAQAAAGAD